MPAAEAAAPSPRLFGRLTVAVFAIVVVSGVALTPFYAPERALESLELIEAGLPYGFWLRAVHWASAVGLLALSCAHVVECVALRAERRLRAGVWWRAVLLLPLLVGAMLGGFVLRGDAEAKAALAIWRGVVGAVPLVGRELAVLLLGPPGVGLGPVALHHAGSFTVLLVAVTLEHVRSPWPRRRALAWALAVSAAVAGAVPLGLGGPASRGGLLLGPFYLLGLQGLLLDLPLGIGWSLGALAVLLLGGLWHARGRGRAALLGALCVVLAAHLFGTARLLLRARGLP